MLHMKKRCGQCGMRLRSIIEGMRGWVVCAPQLHRKKEYQFRRVNLLLLKNWTQNKRLQHL